LLSPAPTLARPRVADLQTMIDLQTEEAIEIDLGS
jgi:hypothetical protein